jgi:hypothetical protein
LVTARRRRRLPAVGPNQATIFESSDGNAAVGIAAAVTTGRISTACQDEGPFWRYRHRLNITSPVTFTPLKIQPYTAGEVFYSFDGQGFNQQRLYGGVYIPLHEKVRLELFYLWKLDKEDYDWHDTNVIGSWVYFQF